MSAPARCSPSPTNPTTISASSLLGSVRGRPGHQRARRLDQQRHRRRLSPGSTFKILTSIAALRSGLVEADKPITECAGYIKIGDRTFVCDNGRGHHGEVLLPDAIAKSCDIDYYTAGRLMTPSVLAAEGRRFHLHQRTGIELPHETGRMVIPDPAYKEKVIGEKWFPGDTANMSIGQGYVLVTPLEMACFAASVARNEVFTKPTLIHTPDAPTQRTESIGLTPPSAPP